MLDKVPEAVRLNPQEVMAAQMDAVPGRGTTLEAGVQGKVSRMFGGDPKQMSPRGIGRAQTDAGTDGAR